MIEAVRKLLAPLQRRVMLMVGRCVLRTIDDGAKLQVVQIGVLAGETLDRVERFQAYGFTSHPLPGAEGVVVFAGGNRAHGLVLALDDRRHRKVGLDEGEVALYTDEGDFILLKRGRVIEVVAGAELNVTAPEVTVTASTKVTLDTPLVEVTGDVVVTGEVTAAEVQTAGGIVLGTHTHIGVQPGSGNTGGPQ